MFLLHHQARQHFRLLRRPPSEGAAPVLKDTQWRVFRFDRLAAKAGRTGLRVGWFAKHATVSSAGDVIDQTGSAQTVVADGASGANGHTCQSEPGVCADITTSDTRLAVCAA